jgi:hypothetical protein
MNGLTLLSKIIFNSQLFFVYLHKTNAMYLDFEIDKLTQSIENVVTGDSFPTEVLPLTKPDLLQINKKSGWKFNWKAEYNLPDRDVFKLTIVNNPTIIHGFSRYIAFTAKTKLIEHYKKTLGAEQFSPQRMMIATPQATFLVQKYFPDFKIK